MKKAILFLCLLICLSSKAQWVNIPDSNFGKWLTTNYPTCMQGNSQLGFQMDTSCSGIVTAKNLNFSNTGIRDLNGVHYFKSDSAMSCNNLISNLPMLPPSIRSLRCGGSKLTTLPILPSTLRELFCDNSSLLSTIPQLPDSISYFQCSYCPLITNLPTLPSMLRILACNNCNLSGLPNLPDSLEILQSEYNQLTSLPFLPPKLKTLTCNNNHLNSLPPLPNTLTGHLQCFNNQLTNLPTLPPLITYLECWNNNLTSLPALPSSLLYLTCTNNQINSLPTLPPSLTHLDCGANQLNNLPPLPPSITYIDCNLNLLTNLPTLPPSLSYLWCFDNQLLSLPDLPTTIYSLDCKNNPSLSCLPKMKLFPHDFYSMGTSIQCVPTKFNSVNFDVNLGARPLCNPLSGCPFFGNIYGNVHLKTASSCSSDSLNPGPYLENIKVLLKRNGLVVKQTYPYNSGEYSFDPDSNVAYSVSIDTTDLPFNVVCPSSLVRNVVLSNVDSIKFNQHFGLTCKGIDVGVINIYGRFRAARLGKVNISVAELVQQYHHATCASIVPGTVTISFSGPVSFVGPVPGSLTPTSILGNTLSYAVTDFSQLSSNSFDFFMVTDTLASSGSNVCFTINTSVANDINPSNNSLMQCFQVANSYDPNQKEAYPLTLTPGSSTGDWITYTVHFQNTGNDTAYDITVRDTLSSFFKLESFQFLGSSHTQRVVQLNGNSLVVYFPNINLVDSATNPPLSAGWFQYRVKTKPNLFAQSQIKNTAYIYFDFNPAIATNSVITNLTCNVGSSTLYDTICNGSVRLFGGIPRSTTGVYMDSIPRGSGCDSVVTLYLNVKPTKISSIIDSICAGNFYSFNGMSLTQAGIYQDTMLGVNGCDSLVTLTLTIKPIQIKNLNITICNNQTYSFNGKQLAIAGIYRDTLASLLGCDSIVVLNLSVNSYASTFLDASVCVGDSFFFKGRYIKVAGDYYDTLHTTTNCDSFVHLHLMVNAPSTNNFKAEICQGQTYSFGGNSLTQSGTYTIHLTNIAGCDSLVTLQLTTLPIPTKTLNVTTCSNYPYFFHGGLLNQTGVYYDTIATANCDSIVTLYLTVNTVSTTNLNQALCSGDSILFNNHYLKLAGDYFDTLQTVSSCDSIVHLHLIVKSTSYPTINTQICQGQSYSFGGQQLVQSGTYIQHLLNTQGCDSTITLSLQVKAAPTMPIISRNGNILTSSVSGTLSYQWVLNTQPIGGATQSTLTISQNGSYALQVTNSNNCSATSAIINVTNVGINSITSERNDIQVFPNPNHGSFTIIAMKGSDWEMLDPLGRSIAKGKLFQEMEYVQLSDLSSGVYVLRCNGVSKRVVIE